MALLSRKKKTEEKTVHAAESKIPTSNERGVLLRPRITEKAAILSSHNAYAFEVAPGSSKAEVIQAVKEIYNVTPKSVRMVTIAKKQVFVRGKKGSRSGGRKAYVFLKKGDKIEVM